VFFVFVVFVCGVFVFVCVFGNAVFWPGHSTFVFVCGVFVFV